MLFRKRDGQAMLELALILTLLFIMMAGVMSIGPLAYVRIATDMASYDCVTTAGRSLNANRGDYQGRAAADGTLIGFGLDPGQMDVFMTAPHDWARGNDVVCVVNYTVQLGRIPLATLITGQSEKTVSSTAIGRIEQFKSNF